MKETGDRAKAALRCVAISCLLLGFGMVSQAQAAENRPYEFDATLSLTGGCKTSTSDPIPDPGCPEKHPPLPFTSPEAIAIDSFGDEYVAVYGKNGTDGRIDVFDSKGVYITELKDEFGPKALAVDAEGNLYVFERAGINEGEIIRYTPTTYKPKESKIAYDPKQRFSLGTTLASVDGLAVDAKTGHVFAGNGSEIREFGSAAEENKLLATITNEKLHSAVWVAVDAQRRRLYTSSCPVTITECIYLVFNADEPHELLEEIDGSNTPEGKFLTSKGFAPVAVDEETGDFFIGDLEFLPVRVYQFNEDYEFVSQLPLKSSLYSRGDVAEGIAISNYAGAFNQHYLFVSSPGTNRALAFHPPGVCPPEIESVATASIGENEAELRALVNPCGGTTSYRFEYLSQQEYEEAGNSFVGAKLAGEGTILPTEQEAEVKAAIESLTPGSAYRFRIFVENEVGEDEKEASFATYNDAPTSNACENQELRLAHSLLLPDCRAYELVTPADTNGRPPKGIGFGGDQFNTVEASPGGNVVSFLIEGGVIPGTEGTGSFNGDLYRTTRTDSGWNTESAGPTGAETVEVQQGSTSPDQGYSFWVASREGSALIEGKETHYVRYPDDHSVPVGRGNLGTDPSALGRLIAEGGNHIIFQTVSQNGEQPIQLEEDAPPTGTSVVYDRTPDEVTHVVSLLPGNETPEAGENAEYLGASADGEGIAFKIGSTLYLRLANTTTYEIGIGAKFAGVSEGGSRIFYVEGGDLFAFDTESEEAIPFTEVGNAVPANVSSDGTRAYFVSTTAIEGSGENPNGAVAGEGKDKEGKPKENLYLSEEGAIRFVGTVTERDVIGENPGNGQLDGLGLWTVGFGTGQIPQDPSRTNPDGSVFLFSSRADLTGYDPEGAPEIYRYDSVGNRLHCVSCIPTKTPATGGASLETINLNQGDPAPFSPRGLVLNLRADGQRAVFQSTEALVSRDNDGVQDIYEWEEQGVGSCTRVGGCIYLISSGRSASDNYLYGLNASGDDVFFTTSETLVGGDGDTLSIYDARVNGGFKKVPCQQPEECINEKPPTPAPLLQPPESEGAAVPLPVVSPNCPKGKHKAKRNGKEVCVKNKKHKKHHRKHHKTKNGAGR